MSIVSTIRVKGTKRNEDIEALISLWEKIKTMGQDIIEAFMNFDIEAANKVAVRDDDIDHLTSQIRKDSIRIMTQDQRRLHATELFICQYLY